MSTPLKVISAEYIHVSNNRTCLICLKTYAVQCYGKGLELVFVPSMTSHGINQNLSTANSCLFASIRLFHEISLVKLRKYFFFSKTWMIFFYKDYVNQLIKMIITKSSKYSSEIFTNSYKNVLSSSRFFMHHIAGVFPM